MKEFSDVSDDIVDEHVSALCSDFPNCGERFLNEMLKQKGLTLQRIRV